MPSSVWDSPLERPQVTDSHHASPYVRKVHMWSKAPDAISDALYNAMYDARGGIPEAV